MTARRACAASGSSTPTRRSACRPARSCRDRTARGAPGRHVGDLEDADVGMEHRHLAGDLGEPDVVAPLGRPQRGRHHVVQLEIRLQLGLIEVVFRLPDLLGVEEIVPGLDRDRRAPSLAAIACMSATSSLTRATAAGQTRIMSACAAFGSSAIVSDMRQCAWLGKPSSFARSARSFTMPAIVALVSFASPLSPRLLNFFQTFSRRSRRVENVRNGSTLDRVLTIAHLPGSPRSSAAAFAAETSDAAVRRDRPRYRAPSTCSRRRAPSSGTRRTAPRAAG